MTATLQPPSESRAAIPSAPSGEVPIGPDSPLFAIMATTRAMRRLAPDPVPDEILRSIIEAATWAPTGSNAQAGSFVLITDRAVMADLARLWRKVTDDYRQIFTATAGAPKDDSALGRMRDAIEYQRDHFAETPALIVACYDFGTIKRSRRDPLVMRRLLRAVGPRRFLRLSLVSTVFMQRSEAASVYPGVQNLLLAARAHGLAACLTTWHLLAERDFKALLGIPKEIETFAVIPVGWPLGTFGPVRRRPVDEVIHRDRW